MGNEITTKSTAADYAAICGRHASRMQTGGGKKFLKFAGKQGDWLLGAESEEISPDQHICINHREFKHGVVGWANREKEHEQMVHLHQDYTPIEALPPIKGQNDPQSMNGYYEQYSFDGAFVDDGLEFRCNGSSAGFKDFVHRLLNDVANNVPRHEDYPNPVISLRSSSYDHKTYGKTYTPDYKLIGWSNDLFEMWDATAELEYLKS